MKAQRATITGLLASLPFLAAGCPSSGGGSGGGDSTPPVVSGAQVTSDALGEALVEWETDEPATWRIDYGETTAYGDSIYSDGTPRRTHSALLESLTPGTTYHLQIVVVDVAGNGGASTAISWSQGDDGTPPVIGNVEVVVESGQEVTISWATDEATEGRVHYGLTSSYGSVEISPTPGATSHSVTLTGLMPGVTYHYRITATDSFANASSTADDKLDTDDETPPVISNLEVTANAGKATIRWETDEPTTGQLDHGPTSAYGTTIPTGPPSSSTYSVLLQGLAPGTVHHFRITSVDVFGNAGSTADQTFDTDDETAPVATNVQISPTGSTAMVTWDTDEPCLGSVDYGPTSAYGSSAASGPPVTTAHSVNLTHLTADTTYHFQITNTDSFGNAGSTGNTTFQTDDLTAPAISGVQVSLAAGSATVSWDTDEESTGSVDYGLTTAYGMSVGTGPSPATSHSVVLAGLDPNTTYHFKVTALDVFANTSFTADQDFLTLGAGGEVITGELVAWFPVTISFLGPSASELDVTPNPFLDYRLNVDFTGPSGQQFNVPGFFAGDGQGVGTGDIWRVRFAPDEGGSWSYTARFVEGTNVAVSLDNGAGTPTSFDGVSGNFTIAPRDPAADGFYRWGLLEHVGEHYLKFRDGPYFVKTGCGSPENFLGYAGFDNTFDQGGGDTSGLVDGLHRYGPHVADWGPGGLGDSDDPLFVSADTGYDSKGIIGALNYLSSRNVNSLYFLPMNLGGDGQDAYPFVGAANTTFDKTHYDVSKLHQWNQVFEHATRRGLMLHFVLAEKETANRTWLDGGGLGVERKLFCRELVARFGHALGIKWNLSEENQFSTAVVTALAGYLQAVDPYDHPVAFHSETLPASGAYPDWAAVLGDTSFSANSIQGDPPFLGANVERWRADSAAAGHKWVVDLDEITVGATDSNTEFMRFCALYDVLFSGGNLEWYMGQHPLPLGGDLRCEDFRTREAIWDQSWYVRRFMEENLPFWEMEPADEIVVGEVLHSDGTGAEVLAKADDTYAVYFRAIAVPDAVDLSGTSGVFQKRWYNPRTGAFEGATEPVAGGGVVPVGPPPGGVFGQDWVVLIKR